MICNFVLINQPLNNRGDESAHKALVRALLKYMPNARIQVLFVDKNQDSVNQFMVQDTRVSYINIRAVRGWRRALLIGLRCKCSFFPRIHPTTRKMVALFKQADMILCAPGGICMGGFQNWDHVLLLSIAKIVRKPIAYYGRSIGPFPTITSKNRKFKKVSLELLRYFSFISLRDEKSIDLAKALNIKYEPTVDSAFLETPKTEVPKSFFSLAEDKPYVVFVPNLLIWHYAYKAKASLEDVLRFYKKILDRIISKYPLHNVVMLPQTFNYGSYNGDDINFFRDLKQYTKCEKLIVLPDTYSSDIQQTIISNADCMIGARYHSIVFAINQAVPFVALSYEHKISGLLESLSETETMVDITKIFDAEEYMQDAVTQFARALEMTHKNVEMQKRAKQMAQSCFDTFVDFCLKND